MVKAEVYQSKQQYSSGNRRNLQLTQRLEDERQDRDLLDFGHGVRLFPRVILFLEGYFFDENSGLVCDTNRVGQQQQIEWIRSRSKGQRRGTSWSEAVYVARPPATPRDTRAATS